MTKRFGEGLTRPEKLVTFIEVELIGDLVVNQGFGIDPVYHTTIPVAFAKAENCCIEEKK